jgi:hypothetical protein
VHAAGGKQFDSATGNWLPGEKCMKQYNCTTLINKAQGLMFTESPRWRDAKLWFLDNYQQLIKTVDLAGKLEVAVQLPFMPNGFGHRSDGSILVGDAFKRTVPALVCVRTDRDANADIPSSIANRFWEVYVGPAA